MSPAKKKAKTSHESFSSKVLGKLTCPITSELCVRPVIAEDGRVYERASIRRWLSSKSTSRTCHARCAAAAETPR